MSYSSLRRGLAVLGIHGYRPQHVQELKPSDHVARKAFCESWISRLENDAGLEDRIFWSDECLIRIGDPIDLYNTRIYATSNPHAHVEIPNSRLGCHFWAGISSRGVIGPFFTATRLNATEYMEILKDKFLPSAKRMMKGEEFWFQQDGAPAHSARTIMDFLDKVLPGKWIGRGGPLSWPARSPDLTPMDFGLWGYVRPLVLARGPRTVEELEDCITTVFSMIKRGYCERLCRSVRDRLQRCREAEGGHIEA
jgi:hypothetical protein